MQHKISIASCFDYDIPLDEQIKYIAEAGFTHLSLGSNLEHSRLFDDGRVSQIKKLLAKNNLSIDTIHFSQSLNTDNWQDIMDKTMHVACELDCPVIVAHLTSFMAREINSEADIQILKSSMDELEMLCNRHKINVALENLCIGKATDILDKMLEYTDSKYIGFCYDSSHDQIDGPRAMTLLEKWKHRLMVVHISDRIKPFTDHVTIGEGFIDFEEMINIIKTVNIEFPLLLEMMKTYSKYKDTEKFLNEAYVGGIALLEKIKGGASLNHKWN